MSHVAFRVSVVLMMTAVLGGTATADVLTVGPHGTYSSIGDAVQAAPSGADTEIRVEAGTYSERVYIATSFSAGSISLSGGWNSSFTLRNPDPSVTFVSTPAESVTVSVRASGGTVELIGFTVSNSFADARAGIMVNPQGASTARVRITDCEVTGVSVSVTTIARGAGLYAILDGSEALELTRVAFIGNSLATTTSQQSEGGGAMVSAADSATVAISGCRFEGNSASSGTGSASGGGLSLVNGGDAAVEVTDIEVWRNTVSTDGFTAGAGVAVREYDSSSLIARRWSVLDNLTLQGGLCEQVRLGTSDPSTTIQLTDSLIALGDNDGVYATAHGTLHLANLSVAGNVGTGIRTQVAPGAVASLYNSIAYGNGTDTDALIDVATGNNLVGVDPRFVNPPYDYRLALGSPAEDAGTNAPPGGLGPADLDGAPRIHGGVVDIGCSEGTVLFADGFENGDTGRWSQVVPAAL